MLLSGIDLFTLRKAKKKSLKIGLRSLAHGRLSGMTLYTVIFLGHIEISPDGIFVMDLSKGEELQERGLKIRNYFSSRGIQLCCPLPFSADVILRRRQLVEAAR